MKFLLDTHIWLWSLEESEHLGQRVRSELKNPENEFWLSPISCWEALLLNRKGRIDLPADVDSWLTLAISNLHEAPLTHEIVLAANNLPLRHHDPADRFLAATAGVLGLTLITADERLLGLGEIATLANR